MGFFRKKSDDDAIKDAESSLIEKPVKTSRDSRAWTYT